MILKYRRTRVDGNVHYDVWNYIDGITDCSVYFNNNPDINTTCIEFGEGPKHMILALYDEAYLINDNGKTIEKIRS